MNYISSWLELFWQARGLLKIKTIKIDWKVNWLKKKFYTIGKKNFKIIWLGKSIKNFILKLQNIFKIAPWIYFIELCLYNLKYTKWNGGSRYWSYFSLFIFSTNGYVETENTIRRYEKTYWYSKCTPAWAIKTGDIIRKSSQSFW